MQLWGFSTGEYHVPTKKEVQNVLTLVDGEKVEADNAGRVTLGENQQIDLGGIAKGYTGQKLTELFKSRRYFFCTGFSWRKYPGNRNKNGW